MDSESKLSRPVKIAIGVTIGFVALLLVKKMIYDNIKQDNTYSDVKEEEVNYKQEDVKQQEIEIISKSISHTNICKLLTTNSGKKYVIIDVRDPKIDFVGGHIVKSINIPSSTFFNSLPEIFRKYNNKEVFILMCMYGAHRSVTCMTDYKKAINEIIKNYNRVETGKSFYYNAQQIKSSKEKITIPIECDELMYQNLCKQRLYTVYEGFFGFINNPDVDRNNKNILVDFDMNEWQELKILDKTKLYHKKEFFATVKASPAIKHNQKAVV